MTSEKKRRIKKWIRFCAVPFFVVLCVLATIIFGAQGLCWTMVAGVFTVGAVLVIKEL